MSNPFEEFLETYFDEVEAREFYRAVFPEGELEEKGVYETGKYTAIALCISQSEKKFNKKKNREEPKIYRYCITDDLDVVDELAASDDLFCLLAPLSYAGKSRKGENARFMYGMAFDLDRIRVKKDGTPIGLLNLWEGHIRAAERLPRPTYIVSSGTGLHLYYLFEKPIPLFPNIVSQLQKMKHELTEMIWNEGIVDIKDDRDRQYEGIFQGFRMVGTITKTGGRARAFETGKRVTIEHLNTFVSPKNQVTEFAYKSSLTKAEAKMKYPEWYEERIVKGRKGVLNPWAVSRNLYDWWKREIIKKAQVGHRYYCLMILAAYAQKCSFYDPKKNPNPVTQEELEKDAFTIMQHFESLTNKEDNHFSESDVLDALDAFDWDMITFPRGSVAYRAGFPVEPSVKRREKGKRLKQADHLEEARAIRDIRQQRNGTDWRDNNGRPQGKSKQRDIIAAYRKENPEAKPKDCMAATGISKNTVYRWWNDE